MVLGGPFFTASVENNAAYHQKWQGPQLNPTAPVEELILVRRETGEQWQEPVQKERVEHPYTAEDYGAGNCNSLIPLANFEVFDLLAFPHPMANPFLLLFKP